MCLCVVVVVSVVVLGELGGWSMEERRKSGRMYRDYLRRVIESDYPVDSILSYEQWVAHMEVRVRDLKQGQFPREMLWSKEVTAI